MLHIPFRAFDNTFLDNIEGYKGNIQKIGRLLLHDWWTQIEPNTKKENERYLFLFKSRILICKIRKISPERSVFHLEEVVKLPDCNIEDCNSDNIIRITPKTTTTNNLPTILKARNEEVRKLWFGEIHSHINYDLTLKEHHADDIRIDASHVFQDQPIQLQLPKKIESADNQEHINPAQVAKDYFITPARPKAGVQAESATQEVISTNNHSEVHVSSTANNSQIKTVEIQESSQLVTREEQINSTIVSSQVKSEQISTVSTKVESNTLSKTPEPLQVSKSENINSNKIDVEDNKKSTEQSKVSESKVQETTNENLLITESVVESKHETKSLEPKVEKEKPKDSPKSPESNKTQEQKKESAKTPEPKVEKEIPKVSPKSPEPSKIQEQKKESAKAPESKEFAKLEEPKKVADLNVTEKKEKSIEPCKVVDSTEKPKETPKTPEPTLLNKLETKISPKSPELKKEEYKEKPKDSPKSPEPSKTPEQKKELAKTPEPKELTKLEEPKKVADINKEVQEQNLEQKKDIDKELPKTSEPKLAEPKETLKESPKSPEPKAIISAASAQLQSVDPQTEENNKEVNKTHEENLDLKKAIIKESPKTATSSKELDQKVESKKETLTESNKKTEPKISSKSTDTKPEEKPKELVKNSEPIKVEQQPKEAEKATESAKLKIEESCSTIETRTESITKESATVCEESVSSETGKNLTDTFKTNLDKMSDEPAAPQEPTSSVQNIPPVINLTDQNNESLVLATYADSIKQMADNVNTASDHNTTVYNIKDQHSLNVWRSKLLELSSSNSRHVSHGNYDPPPPPPLPPHFHRMPGFFQPLPVISYETSFEVLIVKARPRSPSPPPSTLKRVHVFNEALELKSKNFLEGIYDSASCETSLRNAKQKMRAIKTTVLKSKDNTKYTKDTVQKAEARDFVHILPPLVAMKRPIYEIVEVPCSPENAEYDASQLAYMERYQSTSNLLAPGLRSGRTSQSKFLYRRESKC